MIATWNTDVTANGMHQDMLVGESVKMSKCESAMMHTKAKGFKQLSAFTNKSEPEQLEEENLFLSLCWEPIVCQHWKLEEDVPGQRMTWKSCQHHDLL